MTTRIQMINRALLRIGATPIFLETDPGAEQHVVIYDSVLEAMAAHPFSFFKRVVQLVRLGAAPSPAHYAYAYQLPADRVGGPRAVYPLEDQRRPTTDYDIEGDLLLTSHPQIWLAYARTRAPQYWPGDFRECFTKGLMAELALSVREDRPMHNKLYEETYGTPSQQGVGGLLGSALENDSQGTPSTIVGGGVSPLIDCR